MLQRTPIRNREINTNCTLIGSNKAQLTERVSSNLKHCCSIIRLLSRAFRLPQVTTAGDRFNQGGRSIVQKSFLLWILLHLASFQNRLSQGMHDSTDVRVARLIEDIEGGLNPVPPVRQQSNSSWYDSIQAGGNCRLSQSDTWKIDKAIYTEGRWNHSAQLN